jgi:integrase
MDIKEYLKDKRPNLSAGSLTTYTSILKNLFSKLNDGSKDYDVKFFDNYKMILEHLKEVEPKKRKTILSALVVICPDDICEHYRSIMMNDIKVSKSIDIEQKKTEKQKANWITQDEIREKYDNMYQQLEPLFLVRKIDAKSLTELQDLVLLALTSGIYIPPRRSLDWTDMMIRGYDKSKESKDNYMIKNKFYFNRYKTDKTYGLETIDIPLPLQHLLKKYIFYLPTSQKYLFVNRVGEKINSVRVTQALNKIFDGKRISVNMLRHSFISHKYKDIPKLKDMIQTAHEMGHSLNQALEYIKND